jgi:hypothetical protein
VGLLEATENFRGQEWFTRIGGGGIKFEFYRE